MEDDRWAAILRTPVRPDGNWGALPEHGWGATIAFAAGPGRVRVHDVPVHDRHIKHTSTAAGHTTRWTTTMTTDELREIADFINHCLAEVGIPAAPHTWWEIDLPDGVTLGGLNERVDDALQRVAGSDVGPSQALREAEAILEVIAKLYDATPQP